MKLSMREASGKLGVKPKTLRRYFDNSTQPPAIEKIGRSAYIDSNDFNKWIERIAGKPIKEDDVFLKSDAVMQLYGKSYTWLWYVVKEGELAKPFTISRTNFWIKSELEGIA